MNLNTKAVTLSFNYLKKPKKNDEQNFEASIFCRHWKRIKNRDGNSLEFDARKDAKEFIDRAVSNYFELTGHETELMERFKKLID